MLSAPTFQARRLRPAHPALVFGSAVYSYEQLEGFVLQAASFLLGLGVKPGDGVAIWAANGLEWVAVAHAAGRLGAVLLPLNLRLTNEEIAWQLEKTRAKLVLADPERLARDLCARFAFVDLRLALEAPVVEGIPDALDPTRPHTLIFTSGTTGRPKAVVLSWANQLASATASAAALGLTERDRWLLAMPTFHVGGLNILHRCALAQATVVLHDRFDPERMLRSLQEDGITLLSVVPTMLRRLLDLAGAAGLPATVRAILVGGAPIPPDLVERCPQALPTYGMSEACSHITLTRPGSDASERSTAGPTLYGTDVRIVDEEGQAVPIGTAGMIEVRGPTLFQGYFDDPDATTAVMRDGWLRTGDDGLLDERACLRVLSRRSDLIVSGGENVYPSEIEGVLERHPHVAEAAVVGASDPIWGQVPCAFVVSRSESLSARELLGYAAERLARYKLPKHVAFLEALPRLGSGKVDRAALKGLVANQEAATTPLNQGKSKA